MARVRPVSSRAVKPAAVCLAVFALSGALAFPQESSSDALEFSALAGSTFGAIDGHPSVTGTAGISLSRFAMVLVDGGVVPLGNITLLPTEALKISGSDPFTFGIAVHVRVPVRRWEPYALLEPALLINSYRAAILSQSGIVFRNRHSKFGLESGAGLRYYVKPKWGVRAEYKYTSSSRNFNQIQAGVFYQVEGY
jgi:opacity protein-like surface antigen